MPKEDRVIEDMSELEDGPDVEPELDIAALVKSGKIDKLIQSEADKRAKTMEMKYEEKYKKLEEDYVGAYEEALTSQRKADNAPVKMGFEKQVQGRTKKQVVEYFERDGTYGKLGSDELTRLVDEISANDGTLEQLYKGMAESLADQKAMEFGKYATAKQKNEQDIDKEALEAEVGVLKRSKAAAEGESAVGAVSGGWSTRIEGEDKSWEQIEQGFADGDVTREEFENARREHDRERGKYVGPIKEDE